jgi:hypothetical protein
MRAQEFISEISDELLQRYLDRAGRRVDSRVERMSQARDRLNKGYEIYHAETPTRIVHRFEANTPAEAKRYYERYNANYESDVDYDLRLRRATGIMESFDQPYSIQWEAGDYGSYDALAKLDDGTNLSINFNLESGGPSGEDEEWHVEFWRNNSLEITGEGDAQRIFATVLVAIQQFIKKENPERIVFSASKQVEPGQSSEGRARLYDRLVQRYSATWGYQAQRQDAGDRVVYELTQKNTVEENFADGKVKGKSRPGRVKRSGASCNGSVTDLRKRAKNASGEKAKMYHWCANMKSGRKK